MSIETMAGPGEALLGPAITTDPPAATLPRGVRRLLQLGRRLRHGTLSIALPGGLKVRIEGDLPGVAAGLTIHRMRVARRFLLGGQIGFADAHLDGDWDSPDVSALLGYFLQNEASLEVRSRWYRNILERLVHWRNRNSRSGSRRNIAFHYDMGNEFYRRWLDESMTYSSALFAEGAQDLAAGQRAKYARIADLAGLRPGMRVLEIGCGWGGFAEYACAERGIELVGLTLSREQLAFAERRLDAAGLAGRADLRLQDYRDVEGRFDAVVSIEMVEAVGERYWPVYFEKIRSVLAPGGRAALQAILIDDARFGRYRRSPDFIQRYIFPGGMLPSPSAFRSAAAAAGMRWAEDHGFGPDYARTVAEWRARFLAAWDEITSLGFDRRFRRLWSYYLSYCEAGFRHGSIDVRHIVFEPAP